MWLVDIMESSFGGKTLNIIDEEEFGYDILRINVSRCSNKYTCWYMCVTIMVECLRQAKISDLSLQFHVK